MDYEVLFVEDHPEVVEQFAIRHSPSLTIDGKVVCQQQPTEAELRQHLGPS